MRISDWSSDVCSSDLEAGQLGSRQAQRILQISHDTGARVLLLGDNKQTGAIEQGKPFWLMQKLGLPTAELTEAVRQRSEEHTSELQSLMRISYAVFCLKKKNKVIKHTCENRKSDITEYENNNYQLICGNE